MEYNMLQDPNEKNQTSVFRFDAYPGQSNDIYSWDPNIQNTKYENSSAQNSQNSAMFSSFSPPPVAPEVPSSFSFGTSTNTTSFSGQFPFQVTNHGFTDQRIRLILGKRKTDSPPPQPCKQHITEEKMAEHMSRLHISSETVTSPLEPESVKNKRLYMCEEMRKLQTEPILPAALVSHIQGPCTAVVLWQPPARALPLLGTQSDDMKEESTDTDSPPTNNMLESVGVDNESGGSMDLDS